MNMTERPVADQRVLVIDDDDDPRIDITRYLEGVSDEAKQQCGIGNFIIEEADSVVKAEQLLNQSASNPYHLALLDLRLPTEKPRDGSDRVEHGLGLLRFIKESGTAKGVVVVSNYEDYVRASFLGGALDFVGKPIEQESFQPVVLNALQRLAREESERILNQRVRDLVAYAEIGLAHSFKLVFSHLLDGVTEAAHDIEKYVRERYGLDKEKDPYDPLMLALRAHAKAVSHARQDWAGLQGTLTRGGKTLENGNVGHMLRELKESLLPCLVVKNVALTLPDSGGMQVVTFESDVEIVLREIVVGMLSELPDYGRGQINVSLTSEDTRAQVRFEDNLDPIPEEQMDAINEGRRILPDAKFGRVWGLSVAQHVALRGGGELIVKTERGRNVVTYHVPLADYE
jgi:CheY-like chemotaxis protein